MPVEQVIERSARMQLQMMMASMMRLMTEEQVLADATFTMKCNISLSLLTLSSLSPHTLHLSHMHPATGAIYMGCDVARGREERREEKKSEGEKKGKEELSTIALCIFYSSSQPCDEKTTQRNTILQ